MSAVGTCAHADMISVSPRTAAVLSRMETDIALSEVKIFLRLFVVS